MASGTWGDPNVYTKAETDAAIAQSAAKSNGNFTLSYDYGAYTGGLTNQALRYSVRGDIVVLTGTFKMGGTADASHMYAAFSGMPFPALRADTLGTIRCSNDGKPCYGIKTASNSTSGEISNIIMYFIKADGTYLASGETVEITLIYVKE